MVVCYVLLFLGEPPNLFFDSIGDLPDPLFFFLQIPEEYLSKIPDIRSYVFCIFYGNISQLMA